MSILSIKSNDYTETSFDSIIFDFFLIEKDKEKYYADKWSELKNEIPQVKFSKFSNGSITNKLPLNREYLTWGNVILNTKNMKKIVNCDAFNP